MTLVARARHWLPILPLLALLGGSYWLHRQAQPDTHQPAREERHEPDAIIDNLSAVQLNADGIPRFIVAAKQMQHFPDDDSTALNVPRVTMFSPDQPPVHAVARRGTISKKGDEVFLHDDVEVLRSASTKRPELRVHTDYLRIVPERSLVDTDRPVTVSEGRNTLQATGLSIDNTARTFKLLSHVRAEYVTSAY